MHYVNVAIVTDSSISLPDFLIKALPVHVVPFEKLVAQICSGEFTDIKTVAAVLLVARNNALLGSS